MQNFRIPTRRAIAVYMTLPAAIVLYCLGHTSLVAAPTADRNVPAFSHVSPNDLRRSGQSVIDSQLAAQANLLEQLQSGNLSDAAKTEVIYDLGVIRCE